MSRTRTFQSENRALRSFVRVEARTHRMLTRTVPTVAILLLLTLLNMRAGAQTIASEGFNNTSTIALFPTVSGGTWYSGNTSATADAPASSPYAFEGANAYGVSNGTATLTSNNISTLYTTGASLSLRVAALSVGSTANGMDATTDQVRIGISTDGTTNFTDYISIKGNSNARWAYTAGATATTSYPTVTAAVGPASGGTLTTTGLGTITITNLPATATLRVRITMVNDNANEVWVIDDFKITASSFSGAAPTVSSISSNPGSSTTSYIGSTVTVNGSNLDAVNFLKIGGAAGTDVTIVSRSASQLTFTAINAGGAIYVANPAGSNSANSLTNLGYITKQTGTWQTAATWLGGAVPPSATTTDITIAHNVTGTSGSTQVGKLAVNSGVTLTNTSGATLTINNTSLVNSTGTITNNGTFVLAGALTNSGTFTVGSSAKLTISTNGDLTGTNVSYNQTASSLDFTQTGGAVTVTTSSAYWPASNGPVTVNVLSGSGITIQSGFNPSVNTLAVTVPVSNQSTGLTITGTLRLNTNGAFTGNAPIYGAASTLTYNAGAAISVGSEWTQATGTVGTTAGYPNNLSTSSSSTVVTLPAAARGIGGALTTAASTTLALNGGDLNVAGAVTNSGTITLSGGDIYIGGNITSAGTFTPNGRTVVFNGSAAQTVSSALAFAGLSIQNTSIGSANGVRFGASATVSGDLTIGGNSWLVITSTFGISLSGTGNIALSGANGTTGNIYFSSSAGRLNVAGTRTVTSTNGATLSITANAAGGGVSLTGAMDFGSSLSTFGSNAYLYMATGGSVANNAPGYSSGSGLSFSATTYTVASTDLAWGSAGSNIPYNVFVTAGSLSLGADRSIITALTVSGGTFSNNGFVLDVALTGTTATSTAVNITGGAVTLGSGTINVGPAGGGNQGFTMSSGTLTVSGGTLNVNGNFVHSNGTFNQSSGNVNVDGNGVNSVAAGTHLVNMGASTLGLTGGTFTIVDPHAAATGTNYSFFFNSSTGYNSPTAHVFRFGDGVSTAAGGQSTGFLVYTNVGIQRLNFGTLVVNNPLGSNRAVTTVSTVGVRGDATITAGELHIAAGTTLVLGGNLVNSGTLTSAGTLFFAAPAVGGVGTNNVAQAVSGSGTFRNAQSGSTGSFTNLTFQNGFGTSPAITFNIGNFSVSGTVTHTSGTVSTSNSDISFGASAVVNRSAGYYLTGTGQMKKTYGSTGTFVYHLAEATGTEEYSPVSLNLTTNNTSRTIGIMVSDANHPSLNTGSTAAHSLSRYWSFTDDGGAAPMAYTMAMTYISPDDVNGTAAQLRIGRWDATGLAWSDFAPSATAPLTGTALTASLDNTQWTGRTVAASNYTWTGATSSNWNDGTNWSGGVVPSGSDNATIPTTANQPVIGAGESFSISQLTIDASASLTLTGNAALTISDVFTVNGTASFAPASTVTFAGAIAQGIPALNYGNLALTGIGVKTLATTGTIGIAGTYTFNTAPVYANSTISFNGSGTQTINATSYNNLVVAGGDRGGAVITLPSGTIDVAGSFTVSATNYTVSNSGNTINFSSAGPQTIPGFSYGSISNTGNGARTLDNQGAANAANVIYVSGTYTPSTGTNTVTGSKVNFYGTAAQTISAGGTTHYYNDIEISGARGANQVSLGGGIFNVAGVFTYSATSSVAQLSSTSTVNYTGTNQTVAPMQYTNLTLSGTGTLFPAGTVSIAGTFTPGAVTTAAAGTINFNGSGAQTVPVFNYFNLTINHLTQTGSTRSGSVTLGSSGNTIGVAGAYAVTGAFSSGSVTYTATVNYNGTGDQTVTAVNYGNLTISSRTGTVTLPSSGTVGISGVFNAAAATGGMNYVITNSTVNFNSGLAQGIPAFNYFNLTLSAAGAKTLASSGIIGVAGTYTTSAAPTVTGSTIDYNGTGAQTVSTGTYNNLTISSRTGTVTLATGANINVAGTFSPAASGGGMAYTVTSSTVNFNGTGAQTIPVFTYNNLSISNAAHTVNNVTFAAGTININGTFTASATFTTGGYVTTGNTINYAGSGSQTITAFKYNNLTNTGNGARTLSSTGTIDIAGTYTPTTGTVTVGTSTVNFSGNNQTIPASSYYNITNTSGTGTRTLDPSGTIDINNFFTPGALTYTVDNSTVQYSNAGGLTLSNFTVATTPANPLGRQYHNLSVTGAGDWNLAAGITMSTAGNFTYSGSGSFSVNDRSTGTSTLIVDGNFTHSGSGDFFVAFDAGPGVMTVNETFNVGGPFKVSDFSGGGTLTVNGAASITGTMTVNSNALAPNTTVNFNGNLSISGTGNLDLQSATSGGTATVRVFGDLSLTSTSGSTIDFGSSDNATANSVILYGNLTKSGTGSTQTFGNGANGGIVFAKAGTQTLSWTGLAPEWTKFTINSGSTVHLLGNFALGTATSVPVPSFTINGTLDAGTFALSGLPNLATASITVNGTVKSASPNGINDGTTASTLGGISTSVVKNYSTGTYIFTGTSAQTANLPATVAALEINNTSNTDAVTLGSALTLTGALTLTDGVLDLGSNNITAADIVGGSATSYVVTGGGGQLVRTALNGSETFPVGISTTSYSPVTISNASARNWNVGVVNGVLFDGNNIDGTRAVQRSWNITPSATPGATSLSFDVYEANSGIFGSRFNPNNSVAVTHYDNGTSKWEIVLGSIQTMNSTGTLPNRVFTATATGVTDFSPFTIANTGSPLPVSLLSFSGKRVNNRNELKWVTASESNNRGFEVERSPDGRSYVATGFVASRAAGGNSTSELVYTFTDNTSAGTKWYYRLRQVDLDGRTKYSSVVKLTSEKNELLVVDGVYPNPAKGSVQVRLQAGLASGNVVLQLSDMAGRIVSTQSLTLEAGASMTTTINIGQLPAGVYHLKAIAASGDASETVRLVKQ